MATLEHVGPQLLEIADELCAPETVFAEIPGNWTRINVEWVSPKDSPPPELKIDARLVREPSVRVEQATITVGGEDGVSVVVSREQDEEGLDDEFGRDILEAFIKYRQTNGSEVTAPTVRNHLERRKG